LFIFIHVSFFKIFIGALFQTWVSFSSAKLWKPKENIAGKFFFLSICFQILLNLCAYVLCLKYIHLLNHLFFQLLFFQPLFSTPLHTIFGKTSRNVSFWPLRSLKIHHEMSWDLLPNIVWRGWKKRLKKKKLEKRGWEMNLRTDWKKKKTYQLCFLLVSKVLRKKMIFKFEVTTEWELKKKKHEWRWAKPQKFSFNVCSNMFPSWNHNYHSKTMINQTWAQRHIIWVFDRVMITKWNENLSLLLCHQSQHAALCDSRSDWVYLSF